jgi:hypothetical protein
MELSEYAETMRREIAAVTRFADEEVARAGQLISESLDSSIRLTLLDVLSGAADEITAALDDAAVELRLAAGDPTFTVVHGPEPAAPPPPPAAPAPPDPGEEETGTSRVTLRLPDAIKVRAEAAAARDGVSLNAWLVRAASQALGSPSESGAPSSGRRGRGPGRRIAGYARS